MIENNSYNIINSLCFKIRLNVNENGSLFLKMFTLNKKYVILISVKMIRVKKILKKY